MKRLRPDGRSANQLRPLAAEFGVLSASDGSARLSLGDTRVLVGVFGPRPAKSLRYEDPHRATLEVVVELRATSTGTVLSRKLTKSSGNATWDTMVMRAVDVTETLPTDETGRVPALIEISFRPK